MNTADIQKTHFYYVWAILLAFGAVLFAVFLDSLQSKATVFGIMLSFFGFVVILYFSNQKLLTNSAIAFLALGIPFNLDVNLLYRQYVGVTSIDIGVTLLSAFALFILFLYEHYTLKQSSSTFSSNKMLTWAILFYIGAGILSFYNAVSYELAMLELIRMLMLFFIFYVVMNLRTNHQVSFFIFFMSVGVVIEAIIAFIQYKTGRSLGLEVFGEKLARGGFEWATRTSGTIGHPNMLAYYFEILIPLMVAMFLVETRKLTKLWYGIVSIAGIIGIMTTLSRGGWLGLSIALPIVFIFLFSSKLKYLSTYIGIFAGIIVLTVLFVLIAPTVETRLERGDRGSAATRAPLNKAALSIIKQYPVTGVGLNNLAKVFRVYDTSGGSWKFRGVLSHVVHNLYLIVWSEMGTIGLIAFLWIFLSSFILIIRLFFNVLPWQRGVLVGIGAGLIAQMIHGLFDPGFKLLMNTSMLFYSLLGVIGAISVLYNKEKEKINQPS